MRKFTIPTRRQIKREVRNLKHSREADFISDLQNILWHDIESIKDPNLAWKKWRSNFNEVLIRRTFEIYNHDVMAYGAQNKIFLTSMA